MSANELYQQVILDHNKRPRNYGLVPDADRKAEGFNPLCGDRISLSVKLDGERIGAIGFEGESCAICKSSASMMTTAVKGKTVSESEQLIEEFRAMATGKLDPKNGAHHLGRLTVLAGVSQLPMRVKCAILPWHTLHAAFNAIAQTSTEEEGEIVGGGH